MIKSKEEMKAELLEGVKDGRWSYDELIGELMQMAHKKKQYPSNE